MKKRMLSMLLVLAMVLSILPVSVFAADRDSSKEQVRVIVENSVFTEETDPENWDEKFWSGILVDTWVDLNENSTMMSCVGEALAEKGYTAEGLDAGYITSVNGLGAFAGGSMSGWMGTLNDWFINEGMDSFTVANGKLAAGDEIRVFYSLDGGTDHGGFWGNNDTSLKAVKFSAGELEPAFDPKILEYTLTVPAAAKELVFTPTAANKNFQVHAVIGETEYKRTAAIPVADGTDLVVTVGTGPTMNVGAVPTTYTFHVETIRVDPSATAQWPAFQGSSGHNGVTGVATPRNKDDMKVLWQRQISTGWSDIPSPVILADNALFAMSGKSLKKLSLDRGASLGSAEMANAPSYSTVPPTFGGGFIFCPLESSTVQAFRASDLKPLWVYQDEQKEQSQSPILYDNGKIYVGFGYGSGDHSFVCLDASSGELLWKKSVPGGFYWAGASVIGNYVLVGTDQGHIFSWNKDTGELGQDLEVCTGRIRSTICVSGGKAFFTGNKGVFYSLDVNGETGALTNLRSADFSEFGGASTSTPAVYNGIAYVGGGSWSTAKSVVAIDLETMEILWHIDEPAYPQCSMLVSNGHPDGYIYIYTTYNGNPGGVNVIRAKADGSEAVQSELYDAAGKEQFCICSFAVNSDGTLYYKNDSGTVFALGLTEDAKARYAVEADIAAIGGVTWASSSAIRTAREAYDALAPEQQELICNAEALTAAEKAYSELPSKEVPVQLSYAQDDFYMIVPQEITVSSALSDKYGYTDEVTDEPSALDCAIRIHEIMFEDTFAPETCQELLAVTETGFITKFMGEDTSDIGFAVNGRMPNDGVVNPTYGSCTAYNINQASLKAGDTVQFFHYNPAGFYGEIYSIFCRGGEHVTEFTMLTGVQETLAVQGYTFIQEGASPEVTWKPMMPDNQVCTLVMEGDEVGALLPIEGAVTDDEGNFPLVFAEAGTYYLAMISNPDMWTYFIPEICKVTVVDPTPEQQAALDVKKQIDAIGEVTLEKENAVKAAREAYDALTEEQQKLVTNLDTLIAAEAALEALQPPHADAEKIYTDTAAYIEALTAEKAPAVGSTGGEWLVLGLARDGRQIPAAYYENVLAFVRENINDKEQLSRNKSTENSRIILALTAMGKDVTDVDGHNLLQGIADMKYLKKQGINGPIWALIAFDSHNYEIPDAPEGAVQVTRENLIEAILADQLEDGGWRITGEQADPDMTAMALLALAPYCEKNEEVRAAADKALTLLSALQMKDGRFGSWGTANAESCAQVLTALTALGIDPLTDARFIKNGRTVVDALGSYFVEGGGFRHLAGGERNGMSTEQGYYALVALRRFQAGKKALFDMTDVTVEVPYVNSYTDVKDDAWYAGAVQYVTENKLMGGTGNQMFEPEAAMTRGMLVTVLYRASGSPDVSGLDNPFTDVPNDWYTDAVLWAADKKVVNGMEDNKFAPEEPVSREQMVTILFRYANVSKKAGDKRAELKDFADGANVQDWAQEAMQWAVAEKIIQGSTENGENYILPADGATRAEVATVLMRFVSMFLK